ncbi:uncharacterized protein LOC111710065 [Eurytemora carolleeae]|uniref:uncharacterized protein LOC111710065 n=1 Tax=Eurytemora carolleeae TaxID=1294199 RepID=UPI000C783351|nr:uncharacterized protein LOC111710065 [Eurytemora carolleeae]|eukprot:XP_023339855.1 uncharacterized protein LOC111710065 [Eurytemora affinis]
MSEGSPPEDDSSKEPSEDVTEALDDSVKPKLTILRLRQEESFESEFLPQVSEEELLKSRELGERKNKKKSELVVELEGLSSKIEQKEKLLESKRVELRNLEIEIELEVYGLRKEFLLLQEELAHHPEPENNEADLKKTIGKGWRSTVLQRRIYGRLTISAKKEAEEWARQTKRSLVMDMIKHRKQNWISRPNKQKSLEKNCNVEANTNVLYEEHSNGYLELQTDVKIVPTFSFEHIKSQIETKWREEIKAKIEEVEQKKEAEQRDLVNKLEEVHTAKINEMENIEKDHENSIYALNKMLELLQKMCSSERSLDEKAYEKSVWKSEFECPICFEEMSPPTRIWQCVDGHAICETCREKLATRFCPSCCRPIEGRNMALERMARSLYGLPEVETEDDITVPK